MKKKNRKHEKRRNQDVPSNAEQEKLAEEIDKTINEMESGIQKLRKRLKKMQDQLGRMQRNLDQPEEGESAQDERDPFIWPPMPGKASWAS